MKDFTEGEIVKLNDKDGHSRTGQVAFGNAINGPFFKGTVWKPDSATAMQAQVGFAPLSGDVVPAHHTLGQLGASDDKSDAITSFSNVKSDTATVFTQYVGGKSSEDYAYGVKLADATTTWDPKVTHFSYDGVNLIDDSSEVKYTARFALDKTYARLSTTESSQYPIVVPAAISTAYLAAIGDTGKAERAACNTDNLKDISITLQDDEDSERVVLTWKAKATVLKTTETACISTFIPGDVKEFLFEDAIRKFFDVQFDAKERTIKFKANVDIKEDVLVEGASALSAVLATVAAGVALFAF